MFKRCLAVLFGCFFFMHLQAQDLKGKNLSPFNFTISEASDWDALFFRNKGWFGGDGIYSIPLNGVEGKLASPQQDVLFIFSDSMIGQVDGQSLSPGSSMINNAVAVLRGGEPKSDQLIFSWKKNSGDQPLSVFTPQTKQTQAGDYYWLGDGFVNQELKNTLYIFGYRIRKSGSGAFGFKEVGNTLIKIKAGEKPPFNNFEQMDTPFYWGEETGEMGSFGAGIYVNTRKAGAPDPDGYIYIYGIRGQAKKLMVARVKPTAFEKFTEWKFYNGKSWVNDINQSAAVTDSLSNELSVSALPDGRYALIFQVNGITPMVGMRIGASPSGPFGPVIKLWDCKSTLTQKGYFTYNAKAHPSLSAPGELIISYNVNSFDFFDDLKTDPHLYRPRFIRLKFNQ